MVNPRGRVSGRPCSVQLEMAPNSGMLEFASLRRRRTAMLGGARVLAPVGDSRLLCFRMGGGEVSQVLKVLWPSRRTFHLPEVFE